MRQVTTPATLPVARRNALVVAANICCQAVGCQRKATRWSNLCGLCERQFLEDLKPVFGKPTRDDLTAAQQIVRLHFAKQIESGAFDDWASQIGKQFARPVSPLLTPWALGRRRKPRSRNVCDPEGNCLPTTIYLILPASKLGNAIERHVRNELPDVNIEDWDYRVDGDAPASRGSSVNAVSQAVLTFMKNSPPGRYLIKDVCAKLKLTMKQQNALKEALKKKRKIVDDLTLINAGYKVEGKGRAAKSYLCKEASDYGGKPLKVC